MKSVESSSPTIRWRAIPTRQQGCAPRKGKQQSNLGSISSILMTKNQPDATACSGGQECGAAVGMREVGVTWMRIARHTRLN